MTVKIYGSGGSGTVALPSSKSFTQRYILGSAFLNKNVTLNYVTITGDDSIAMDIAQKAGASITVSDSSFRIRPSLRCPEEIYVGESATSYRIAVGLLGSAGCITHVTGDPSLARRPMEPLIKALEANDVHLTLNSEGFYDVNGTESKKRYVEVDGVSSQFVSSMIFYYAKKGGGEFLVKNMRSPGYVYITKRVLYDLGYFVNIEKTITINPSGVWKTAIDVEPDYSSLAFFLVLGLLSENVDIRFNIKRMSRIQPDSVLLDMFKDNIAIDRDTVRVLPGIKDRVTVDADRNPDLCPPLSVIGIFSDYGVEIDNYARLRTKESNRYEGMVDMASRFGAIVEDNGKDLFIKRGELKNPGTLSYSDHRMIMSAAIAAAVSGLEITVDNETKVSKSFPGFFKELSRFANISESN
ncbi:3-phosphoshikimate 1-carboxyvinyltransferase [Thermoplasma sp.]|uniref:3-phosphoshikimate 1-carboxyvinyltransferase n=1 Tax=Thermoplasma sp. TaxID=1973142 RepID=UPI00127CDBC9|nr:3-phosphoshikimate 1-carboxyvinyltransferase [Thermoplasma sp.]KAA8922741.1 MAG: 3-phosphoshikimate 1-carboxyvinyltransferase [Thermoplasma sp.]